MKPVIVNSCNIWQEYSSFDLVGVFTNRTVLNKIIERKLGEGDVQMDADFDFKTATIVDLNKRVEYLHFNEVEINEEQ